MTLEELIKGFKLAGANCLILVIIVNVFFDKYATFSSNLFFIGGAAICFIMVIYKKYELSKLMKTRAIETKIKEEEKEKQQLIEDERRDGIIKKYGENIGNRLINKEIWIDMTKDMLIESWGNPEDEKENISREKTKLKWSFGSRTTKQGTIVYKHEVRLENDIVEGWKELE